MQSEKNSYNVFNFEVFEDKRAIKFRQKNANDVSLQDRIDLKYLKLAVDPYREAEGKFVSRKCPKCLKTKIGDYRIIYYVHKSRKQVEIIDIGLREGVYDKW